jgi:4-amino-4-deoxy-L-arabinose transferase-like glycosyltransferase
MTKGKNNNLHRFFLIGVLAFGLVLRVILLDVVPPGLANDEANIILNAQSLLKTGKNIPGVVTGIFGTPSGDYISGAHSEMSSHFLSLVYFFSGFSLSSSRLPFAIASLGIVIFLYLLSKELFGKKVASIVFILAVINPWLIQFGRAGYESIISCLFYLAGIYVFLKTDKWKRLYSLPFLLMGFFSYFSAKVLLLPISLSLLIYELLMRRGKNIKPAVVLNLLIIITLGIYYPLLRGSYPGQRIKELSGAPYATTVDFKRTHSIEFPYIQLTENKILENVYDRTIASLGGLSPTLLFLNGQPESSGHLQIPDHGPMYILDFLFIICGLIYLSRKHLNQLILFLLLIVSSLLPNFFDIAHTTYSMRPVVLIPVLIIISGVGINGLYKAIKNKKIRTLIKVLLTFTYLFLFIRFVFNYYFRLPIENSGTFYFHDRITTHYIQETLKKYPERPIVWIVPERHFTMYRYIYFSGLYSNSEKIKATNKLLEAQSYQIGNLKIENSCPEKPLTNSLYIIDSSIKCKDFGKVAVISNINDAGEQYYLANDPLCQGLEHRRYPLIRDFSILSLERLSDTEFCTNYILNQD